MLSVTLFRRMPMFCSLGRLARRHVRGRYGTPSTISVSQLHQPQGGGRSYCESGLARVGNIGLVYSDSEYALSVAEELQSRYEFVDADEADVVVALGGDGFMLESLHRFMGQHTPIFGMNCGSVGFLMNECRTDNLPERIAQAEATVIHPLEVEATDAKGREVSMLAINELSILRQTRQAAKLRILVNGKERLEELICDGVIVATPAGSTAYNLSAHGPIIPLGAPLHALTPISAFRPRRWTGALLPCDAVVEIEALNYTKRPVSAVADDNEVRDVRYVVVREKTDTPLTLLSDPGEGLKERILTEQFSYT